MADFTRSKAGFQTNAQRRQKIMKNLQDQIEGIEERTLQGLIISGFLIRGRAVKQTPIDVGNLRNSAYVLWKDKIDSSGNFTGKDANKLNNDHKNTLQNAQTKVREADKQDKLAIILGFTAFYAVFIHEMNKFYTVGTWKFLEKAVSESATEVINIIKENAKLKG